VSDFLVEFLARLIAFSQCSSPRAESSVWSRGRMSCRCASTRRWARGFPPTCRSTVCRRFSSPIGSASEWFLRKVFFRLFVFVCSDFDTIRTCFNDELEKCKDSTPANIVDAFFKFLKKHMPCDKDLGQMEPLSESSTGAASAIFVTSFATVAVSALISRYL
jgi:hypothetical protein